MSEDVDEFFRRLFEDHEDNKAATHHAYQVLENAGLISKVALQRYICKRCGVLATVIRVDDRVLARTRDYKQSPGLNDRRSVESARLNNTLDGNRHWPSHTFDLERIDAEGMAIEMNCRHVQHAALTSDVLAAVAGVEPGHPAPPVLL